MCKLSLSGYTGTPKACIACHTTDYNNTTNPNHITANFPTTCVDCHSTTAWQPATFDHNITQFPLTGAHTNYNLSILSCFRIYWDTDGLLCLPYKQIITIQQIQITCSKLPNNLCRLSFHNSLGTRNI